MAVLTPEDMAAIQQIHASDPGLGPPLVGIGVHDPVTGGQYRLAPQVADAFSRANADFKSVFGHDIPVASAYRDPQRNRNADGAPNSNHLHGSALDIDRSAVAKAAPFLQAHGLQPLGGTWHGRSEDNHFELKGQRPSGGAPAPATAPQGHTTFTMPPVPQAAPQPLPDLPTPHLQPGQAVAPIPATLMDGSPLPAPSLMSKQADAFNQGLLQQANQPVPHVAFPPMPDIQGAQANAQRLMNAAAPVGLPQQAPPSGTNFLGDLVSHALNAGAGYTQDDLIRNSGHGIGAMAGDLFGGLVPIGAGSLAGAGLGALGLTPFSVAAGGIGGGIAGAGAAGTAQDLQAQRLEGKGFDLLRGLGAGGIQAALQALPVLKSEKLIAAIAKNAALHGAGGALAGAGQQGLEQGTIAPKLDLGRVAQMGALGAAGGALAGKMHGKPEVPANVLEGTQTKSPYGFINGRESGKFDNVGPGPGHTGFESAPHEIFKDQPATRVYGKAAPEEAIQGPGFGIQGDKNLENFRRDFQIQRDSKEPVTITDAQGRPVSSVKPGLKSSLDAALDRFPEEQSKPGVDLLHGTALPEGRPALDASPKAQDLLAGVKSAKDSAESFKANASDVKTAESIAKDAGRERVASEKALEQTTGVKGDLVEAQRTLGRRILDTEARSESLTPEEHTSLMADRELLDRVLTARQQENEALKLLEEERQTAQRSQLPQPGAIEDRLPTLQHETPSNALPSTKELAMERADELGGFGKQDRDLLNFKKPVRDGNLLDFGPKQDRSAELVRGAREEAKPNPNNLLEFPSRQARSNEPLELLGPNGKPLAKDFSSGTPSAGEPSSLPVTPAAGGEVFHQGQAPEAVNQAAQSLADAVKEKGGQLISIAEAQRFMRETKRPGMEHLLNFLEAGKNSQTADLTYTPLKYGRGEEHTRTVTPFALEKRALKASTEFSNLKKQFSDNNEAIRDHVVQRLRDYGQTVNANEMTASPSAIKKLIERLDRASGGKELTHVYLHSHNFGETTELHGASERGYRLDTIKESSLTGDAGNIPTNAKYQNELAPAYDTLNKLVSHPDAPPEMKRIVKQISTGAVSKPSMSTLRKILMDAPKHIIDSICGL